MQLGICLQTTNATGKKVNKQKNQSRIHHIYKLKDFILLLVDCAEPSRKLSKQS